MSAVFNHLYMQFTVSSIWTFQGIWKFDLSVKDITFKQWIYLDLKNKEKETEDDDEEKTEPEPSAEPENTDTTTIQPVVPVKTSNEKGDAPAALKGISHLYCLILAALSVGFSYFWFFQEIFVDERWIHTISNV